MKCVIVEDERMSMNILVDMINMNQNFQLLGTFENPMDAISFLSVNKVDLIFLDVEMEGLSGFELLDSLNFQPKVILTTSKKDYAFQAFEYNVSAFLLKPFSIPKFTKAIGKVLDIENEMNPDSPCGSSIFVKTDKVYENILFNDILYIEALGDFVKIHTISGRIVTRTTMKEIENGINKKLFMRIHRSFIVNLSKVSGIEDNAAIINNAVLPIGKIYRDLFFSRINIL